MQAEGVYLNDILLQYLEDGGRSEPSDVVREHDPVTRLLRSYGPYSRCGSLTERESLNSEGSCTTSLSDCATLHNNLRVETMSNTVNSHSQRGRDHVTSLNNNNNNDSGGFTNWWNDMLMSTTTHEPEALTTTTQVATDNHHEGLYSQARLTHPNLVFQGVSTRPPDCYNFNNSHVQNQEPNVTFRNHVPANMAMNSYNHDILNPAKEMSAKWAFPRPSDFSLSFPTSATVATTTQCCQIRSMLPNPAHTLSLLRDDHHPHADSNPHSHSNSNSNPSMAERMKPPFQYLQAVVDVKYSVSDAVMIPSSGSALSESPVVAAVAAAAEDVAFIKRLRSDPSPSCNSMPNNKPPAKKERIGDRIATLQQLVSPFGKTDTASVLLEAIGYIKLLHDQVQVLSTPYMQKSPAAHNNQIDSLSTSVKRSRDSGYEEPKQDLQSKGLCLVPLSWTMHATNGL